MQGDFIDYLRLILKIGGLSMNAILKSAKALENELLKNRRFLHQHAELGSDLPLTSQFVLTELRAMGYEPEEICPCGIIATIGNGNGQTILLRADMDALPMDEENNLPYKSTTAAAHTCGHDAHTAMLLTAAKILKAHEEEINGTITLMFQPDEEGIHGAELMVEAGVLENPPVDAAMAIHVSSQHPAGVVYCKSGEIYASADGFEISIHGRGGHGASPHTTIDPINIAAHLYLALQTLISRESNPADMGVLTVGAIHAGTAGNIIPETLIMRGTIRSFNRQLRQQLKERLLEVSTATAAMFGGSAKVNFINSTPAMLADTELTQTLSGYLKTLLPMEQVQEFPSPFSGSEDFAILSEKVPATMLILGCAVEGEIYDHHHPKVQFNEQAFVVGAAAYAHCALEWLKNH